MSKRGRGSEKERKGKERSGAYDKLGMDAGEHVLLVERHGLAVALLDALLLHLLARVHLAARAHLTRVHLAEPARAHTHTRLILQLTVTVTVTVTVTFTVTRCSGSGSSSHSRAFYNAGGRATRNEEEERRRHCQYG